MERDLCDLMANGCGEDDGYNGYNDHDFREEQFSGRNLGMALTLGEMIAEEETLSNLMESIDTTDPADLMEALEIEREQEKVQRISLKSRHTDIPAFEQYVYQRCGIAR